MIRRLVHLSRLLPFVVIVSAFIWSAVTIYLRRSEESPPGVIVLRIGHWQLEPGVRDGLSELAREYEALHPNVRVLQEAIPEATYGQWVSTQLIGSTAPDILQIGNGLPYPVWLSYLSRYFTPLTSAVVRPNPYAAGTSLADVPLRDTYLDGMRNSYYEELQEYMTVPLSQFAVRIFYNRDLLKRLTGLNELPTEYRAFLSVCEQIAKQTNERGESYISIAGSRYNFGMWEGMLFDLPTFSAYRRADANRDGYVGSDEMFAAVSDGRINFTFDGFRAKFQMMREVTRYFPTGYTGLSRDEAVFLFAQQRALIMTTGTWDARGLVEQTNNTFQIGVADFPLPARDDPAYGRWVEGPAYERPSAQFSFGVTRSSQHPEAATDFLLFLASRQRNEQLNRIIGWIPAIRGAAIDPFLQAFQPHLEGTWGNMNINLGGETIIRWSQLTSLFQVGQIDYDELAKQFEQAYRTNGLRDYQDLQRDWRRGLLINEQMLAGLRGRMLVGGSDGPADAQTKYESIVLRRQLFSEIGHARGMQAVQGQLLRSPPPYKHSPEVLARMKARLNVIRPKELPR